MADKRSDIMGSFRIPPELKAKVSRSARKNLRTINQQLIYDICLAEHVQDFSPEKDLSINFFELGVIKVK